jgi:hypothetical protein
MNNALRFIASLIGTTALGLSSVSAHHPGIGGTGGGGGITTIGAGTLDPGQLAAAFMVEYIKFRQLSDATLLANAGHDVHGLSAIESRTMSPAYGITSDLMVSARLPWVRRSGIREGVQEDPLHLVTLNDRGSTSGVGDLTVLGQFRFLNDMAAGTQVAALFGVKAPTGRTGEFERFGERFETEFQAGSGSWDGLFGAAFSQRLNASWSVHDNVLAVATGTGSQDTNLGNRFIYNAAVVYRVFGETANERHGHDAFAHAGPHNSITKAPAAAAPHNHVALDAMLELNGEWHDKQRTAAIADPNSGGNTIFLSPGLRLTVEKWSGFLSLGIPVVTDVNGTQAKSDWRLLTGVAAAFGP